MAGREPDGQGKPKDSQMKAKGKSKVIVLVDSNDKGQLSMLRDQLSKSRLENNKLKNK